MKTNETGRSMVEMLGVLAIIGVLSVAGIAGYTTAMRSYRTNEIVNAASMLYVMGMATNKGEGTGTLNYSDIATNPKGVSSLSYASKAVIINITDADDCAMVKNKLGDKATGDCSNLNVNFGEETDITVPEYYYEYWKDNSDYASCRENGGTDAYCGCLVDFDDMAYTTCSNFSSCIATGKSFRYCECMNFYEDYSEEECQEW